MGAVAPFAEAIGVWMAERQAQGAGVNLAALHAWLEAEHGLAGSLRFVRRHYPAPRIRTRRRAETPPGAQGQAD